MQQPTSSCWQCGTLVSGESARCSTCGAEQLAATANRRGRATLSSDPDSDHGRSSNVAMWVALFVGLGIIAAGAVLLRPRGYTLSSGSRPPLATAAKKDAVETPPGNLGAPDLRAVDPLEVLGRAKIRALAWSKDAVLVAMRARPVTDGRVNVQAGGTVEFWFGKPTGEGFGPGMKVLGKRLHISLESTGTTTDETAAGAGRAALEPNCLLDVASKAAEAAGLTPPLVAMYDVNERIADKPVWRMSTDGNESAQRQIDGMSCAVLVR
ncbi:MAG TPA: hypothetical protein VH062_12570 [Polyangiaceae bacterium]|jgi:hypothetical protein|nr:hypothetical protein [Polyangiaceae bacterium]